MKYLFRITHESIQYWLWKCWVWVCYKAIFITKSWVSIFSRQSCKPSPLHVKGHLSPTLSCWSNSGYLMPNSESYRLRIHLKVLIYFDVFSPFAWTSLHLDTMKPWLCMDKFTSRQCKTLALLVGHVLTQSIAHHTWTRFNIPARH